MIVQDKISFTQIPISIGREQLSPYKFMPTKIIYRKGQAAGTTRRKEMDQLKNNYGGALLELHNYIILPTRL